MRLAHLAWAGPLALILLAILPAGGMAAPVNGTVVNCLNSAACTFTFNTTAGTGWANTTNGRMSFQLPGEAKASYNLSYSAYIEKLTGTYTYWTIGTFLGTDVNTGTVVFGTTDSNYTITCVGHSGRGGGCTYIDTTDNGSVTVTRTAAEMTATTLSCSPTTLSSGRVSCTATVANLWNSSKVPSGKLHISFPYGGKPLSKGVCTLSSTGSCKFTWTAGANLCGAYTITVTYPGTLAYYTSSSSKAITLTDGC